MRPARYFFVIQLSNSREYMREWEKLSHHARSIIASNLDVYDENGSLIVKASDKRTY